MTFDNVSSPVLQPVPRVSVLMTVYNDRPEFVTKAIESIQSQTFTDFEFVILSDGTTCTATLSVLEKSARLDERIVLRREPHRGLVKTLNSGLSICRASLICRQDADDWSEPNRLAKQSEFMHRHESIGVVGSAVELCQENGRKLWTQSFICETGQILESFPKGNPFCHGAICFRASAARALGGYNESLQCTEDYDFLWRMCERFGGANLTEVLYHHRRSPGSVVSKMNDVMARERVVVRLLAQQRAHGAVEDIEAARLLAARNGNSQTTHLLGMADQQLLAGNYLSSLHSYATAILREPHRPKAYLKTLRWLLFVLVPSWRARLFGH